MLVDNDVNIMALGEHHTHWRGCEHLLYVKVGTGIGCGIISGNRIHRGAQGAAGDIGHVRLAGHQDVVCRCGNIGLPGGRRGRPRAGDAADRGRARGQQHARRRVARPRRASAGAQAVRDAGRSIGEVLAECINFFNPGAIDHRR